MTLFPSRAKPRAVAPDGFFDRSRIRATQAIDHRWGWDNVPLPVSVWTLLGLRMKLRRANLFDPAGEKVDWGPEPSSRRSWPLRSLDGTGNDRVRIQLALANEPEQHVRQRDRQRHYRTVLHVLHIGRADCGHPAIHHPYRNGNNHRQL